jgi:hypothetical protein
MLLRIFSFVALLMLAWMGYNAGIFYGIVENQYFLWVLTLAVLAIAAYTIHANFPKMPWSKR